jgi:hypothetical protein
MIEVQYIGHIFDPHNSKARSELKDAGSCPAFLLAHLRAEGDAQH